MVYLKGRCPNCLTLFTFASTDPELQGSVIFCPDCPFYLDGQRPVLTPLRRTEDPGEERAFIQDAIKGGYLQIWDGFPHIHRYLTEPLVWKCVGNTRGWKELAWQDFAVEFMALLVRGKTITEALSAIRKSHDSSI